MLVYFVRRRRDVPFSWMFLMFGLFIVSCGFTHFLEVVTFTTPLYRLSGLVKVITAAASWATVVALVHLTPRALALRSPEELEKEIAIRRRAEAALQQAHAELESRVEQRTAELAKANAALKGEIRERRRSEAERERLVQQLEAERGRLETVQTELRKQASDLARADRHKDEFLAMLAHELRNPLAPIRNALHVLHRRQDHPPTVQWAHDIIDRQATHMTRIVDDLLDVSRISRGKIQLRRERIDLARLVRHTAEDHRGALEAAGLSLEVEAVPGPVWVQGDATRLSQVLGNLLQNAAKFTDRGGRVTVGLELNPEGRASVTVHDTGIGIEAHLLSRVFEAFTQADRSLDRSRGGLGLGLALVRGLVELHGGTVHVSSAGLSQGTAFSFELPVATSAPEPELPLPQPPQNTRPLRILVVEDNLDTAETMRLFLGLAGHVVAVAHAGPEGVDQARQFRPDVVLCDIGLPGMDGFCVAQALRAEEATANARLIAVSGYGQEEDRRRCRTAGFDMHLTKPVDPAALQRLLEM